MYFRKIRTIGICLKLESIAANDRAAGIAMRGRALSRASGAPAAAQPGNRPFTILAKCGPIPRAKRGKRGSILPPAGRF
jgi:hypothetical protein